MKDPVDPYKDWMQDGYSKDQEKVEQEIHTFENSYFGFWSVIAVALSWSRIKEFFIWCWYCFHPEDKGD